MIWLHLAVAVWLIGFAFMAMRVIHKFPFMPARIRRHSIWIWLSVVSIWPISFPVIYLRSALYRWKRRKVIRVAIRYEAELKDLMVNGATTEIKDHARKVYREMRDARMTLQNQINEH